MKVFPSLVALAIGVFGVWAYIVYNTPEYESNPIVVSTGAVPEEDETNSDPRPETREPQEPEVVVTNLSIPWDIAFLPNGEMLVTERGGRLLHIEKGTSFSISGTEHVAEAGLLGIALHPEFESNNFVYLYQTTDVGNGLENSIVRYVYDGESLTKDRVILEGVAGAKYHDGGRIEFGPDGKLYVTVGDATEPASAQDVTSRTGSILRLNDDGTVPEDSPFPNGIYSYGHRNPQGIAWDTAGRLWSTEHGRSGVTSGLDEINLIAPGANYGWPQNEGDTVLPGTVAPSLHSTPSVTWAPASLVYHEGSLFFGGLRGQTLYQAVLADGQVVELREHFAGEFGRIRTIRLGPDGFFYITTSNRDGRGNPVAEDDRIIRIDPLLFSSN